MLLLSTEELETSYGLFNTLCQIGPLNRNINSIPLEQLL